MLWLFLSSLLVQAAPQTPARDVAPPTKAGTAIIRGRVTDKESGEPLFRVQVRITGTGLPNGMLATSTAADGRYELTRVPAGSYTVVATPPAYRATHLPQVFGDQETSTLFGARTIASKVEVADGQVRDRIDIAMSRALAISGRVVDETGEPLANIRVKAESVADGRPGGYFGSRETDDRGMFRLFGLAPGRYKVCTESHSLMGSPDADAPLAGCYPDASARPIELTTAEGPEIELRLRRGRTYTISGTVTDSSGQPVSNASVSLTVNTPNGSSTSGVGTTPGGRFVMKGLIPGEYVVSASIGANRYDSDPNSADKRDLQMAILPLRIDASDLEGIVLTLARGMRINGRVVVEDGPLPRGTTLSVAPLIDRSSSPGNTMSRPVRVNAEDLTFEIADLFVPAELTVQGLPKGWVMKFVRSEGRDYTDRRIDVVPGTVAPVEVVISSRGATISGSVTDDNGAPLSGVFVMAFPVDFATVTSAESFVSAFVEKGTYVTRGLRAGEYFVAALGVGAVPPQRAGRDQILLERLARVAQRVVLAEGEARTLDLRLVKLPER